MALPAGAESRIVGIIGRRGLVLPKRLFCERVGGEKVLHKILNALTVTEKVTNAGRPRGMARTRRAAYIVERDRLIIPRAKGAPFLRARGPSGLPMIDEIIARGLPNFAEDDWPLPAPRALAPETAVTDSPLYSYQEAAVRYITAKPDSAMDVPDSDCEPRTVYLQMDTGLGKTRVGCAVVAARAQPALIVVPTEAIAFQWLDEFAESYPNMRVALYRNEDERRARAAPTARGRGRAPPTFAGPATHDAVVVIVNTFREKSPDFLAGYGITILDEAHELHSAHNLRCLWLAQTQLVLGLSATPLERPDGLDRYVAMHLGDPVPSSAIPGGATTAVNFRGEVRIIKYVGETETVMSAAGTMSAIGTITSVLADAARRRLVAAEVRRLLYAHEEWPEAERARCGLGPRPPEASTPALPAGGLRRHGVFVFAELRDALPDLRDELERVLGPGTVLAPELDSVSEADPDCAQTLLCSEQTGVAAEQTGVAAEQTGVAAEPDMRAVSILRGGAARDAVGRARAAGAHVVLTTYGFSRRGISLPDMTALVLASPRRNGSTQTIGRILRRGSDESILRVIVDIVDVATGLKSQVTDRKRIYTSKRFPITEISVTHQEFALATPSATAINESVHADMVSIEASTDELIAMLMARPASTEEPTLELTDVTVRRP